MRFLDGFSHGQQHIPGDPSEPGSNAALNDARSEGDRMLQAADEVIRRALSTGNSEALLRAGRQRSGQ